MTWASRPGADRCIRRSHDHGRNGRPNGIRSKVVCPGQSVPGDRPPGRRRVGRGQLHGNSRARRSQPHGQGRRVRSGPGQGGQGCLDDLHQRRWGELGLFPPTPGGDQARAVVRRLFEVFGEAKAADEAGCAKTILATLARRAYRRAVTDEDAAAAAAEAAEEAARKTRTAGAAPLSAGIRGGWR